MSECVWMCVLKKWMDVCMGVFVCVHGCVCVCAWVCVCVCVSQEMGVCVGVK